MKVALWLSLAISVSLGTARAGQAPDLVTAAQVERWTRMWQGRLSLEDWRITTEIVRASQLRPNTLGNLHWDTAAHTATIRVLDPLDYDLPASEIPSDIEFTVVHELIHLQLAALPRDPARRGTEEKVVNRIAEALLSLEMGPSYRPRAQVDRLQVKDKAGSEASRSSNRYPGSIKRGIP